MAGLLVLAVALACSVSSVRAVEVAPRLGKGICVDRHSEISPSHSLSSRVLSCRQGPHLHLWFLVWGGLCRAVPRGLFAGDHGSRDSGRRWALHSHRFAVTLLSCAYIGIDFIIYVHNALTSYTLISLSLFLSQPVPYYCAQDNATMAITTCSRDPEINISIADLVSFTKTAAMSLHIDAPSNLTHDRVYVFQGTKDALVDLGEWRILLSYSHSQNRLFVCWTR